MIKKLFVFEAHPDMTYYYGVLIILARDLDHVKFFLDKMYEEEKVNYKTLGYSFDPTPNTIYTKGEEYRKWDNAYVLKKEYEVNTEDDYGVILFGFHEG